MKTTIDIPDPLYRQVKIKAFERGTSLRALMINSLRREVEAAGDPVVTPVLAREEQAVYTTDDLGFVVLKRSGRKPVVNDAFINDLRDTEGV
ncbi:MAG TPA: antitoxin [Kiritimatiellia bacterium]|nr:antitoxin [Kiritimatiellia bacterium]